MLAPQPDGRLAWRIDPAIFAPDQPIERAEEVWAQFARIQCPTLVLRGADTDILSVATCERMAASAPACRWVEIAAAGHMVLEDNPDDTNRALLAFVDALA
jgi:pimeloyl-ACP methyl ester carboxylesterase